MDSGRINGAFNDLARWTHSFLSVSITVFFLAGAPSAHARNLLEAITNLIPNSTCAKLKDWVSQPGLAPNANARGVDAYLPYVKDGAFVPYFGKPYDQLTIGDIRDFEQKTKPACEREGKFTQNEWRIVNSTWSSGWQQALAGSLAQTRVDQAELERVIATLGQLQPNEADFGRLSAIQGQATKLLPSADFQAQSKYEEALAAAKQRVVEKVLVERAQAGLAAAKGFGGYRALIQLRRELSDAQMGLSIGHPVLGEIDARIDQLVDELVLTYHDELNGIPKSITGLEASNQWLRSFDAQWRLAGAIPSKVLEVRQLALSNRQVALTDGKSALIREIRQCDTPSGPSAVLSRYLIDEDRRTTVGAELIAAANQQADVLEKRAAIARGGGGRNGEQGSPMDSNAKANASMRKSAPAMEAGEPSEEVMYDLMKTRFDRSAAVMRDLQQRCQNVNYNSNTFGGNMDAMVCLGVRFQQGLGTDTAIKIVSFRKLGCSRANGKPGFVCDYMIKTSHAMHASMGSIMGGMMDSNGFGQARFLDAGDQWVVYFDDDKK